MRQHIYYSFGKYDVMQVNTLQITVSFAYKALRVTMNNMSERILQIMCSKDKKQQSDEKKRKAL